MASTRKNIFQYIQDKSICQWKRRRFKPTSINHYDRIPGRYFVSFKIETSLPMFLQIIYGNIERRPHKIGSFWSVRLEKRITITFPQELREFSGWSSPFHKYSGVDFSHTICPKCLKTHYPKEYAQIASEKKRTIQWRFRKIHLLKVEKLFDSQ